MLTVFALKNPGRGFVFALKNPGRGVFVALFSLKNPGRGVLLPCALSKTRVGVCVDRVRSQKPLVGCVLTVLALKNPGRVDRARSQKPWWGFWNLNFQG